MRNIAFTILLVCALTCGAFAVDASTYYRAEYGNRLFKDKVCISSSGSFEVDGATELGAITQVGNTTQTGNVVRTGTLNNTGATTITGALVHVGAVTRTGNTTQTGNVSVTGTINGHDELRTMAFSFFDPDVAASQTAAAWGMDASASVGGASFKEVPIPFAGSVIGVAVYSNAACTTGTLTVDPTINGTVTGLQAVINSTNTQEAHATQAKDTDAFTAGQRVGVKVTTSADWAHTTADAVVVVYVEY